MDELVVTDFDLERSIAHLSSETFSLAPSLAEDIFSEQGISFSAWLALVAVRENIVANAAELATKLRMSSRVANGLIEEFERRGQARRERTREDRRVIRLVLTDGGRLAADQLQSDLLSALNGAQPYSDHESTDELSNLLIGLRRDRGSGSPASGS